MHKALSLAQTSSNLIEYLTCRLLKKKSMMLLRNQSLIVRNFPSKFVGVLEGFNGTIFAYGQTSSGKTHTMQGPDIEDLEMQGIIPRMVRTVFNRIETASENIEFTVKISMIEIYMEKIKDLLDSSKDNLKIHEDKTKGVYIADVTETYVSNDLEVY